MGRIRQLARQDIITHSHPSKYIQQDKGAYIEVINPENEENEEEEDEVIASELEFVNEMIEGKSE
jgi:hypothetical protein